MKMQHTADSVVLVDNGQGGLIFGAILGVLGLIAIGFQLFGASGPTWVGMIFSAVPLLLGIALMFSARTDTITVTRGESIDIVKKHLLRKTESHDEFPTSDISEVRIETRIETTRKEGKTTDRRQVTELSLVRHNGPSVELKRHSTTAKTVTIGASRKNIPLTKEGEALAEVIGVPLNIVDLSTLKGTMTAVQEAAGEVSQNVRDFRGQAKK